MNKSPRPLLRWSSYAYAALVRGHEWLYVKGWLKPKSLPRLTISVGNITAGGTGKTPLVLRLARDLMQRGFSPGILLRGYKRQTHSRRPVMVRDANMIHASVEHAGDEAMELAYRLPGACVAVGANRYAAGRLLLERNRIDCFILDDGFQHHRLRKDLNLVTLDATDPWGGSAFLPAGLLRQSPEALSHAHAVILTRVRSVSKGRLAAVRKKVSALAAPKTPIFETHHEPEKIFSAAGESEVSLNDLKGKHILAVSAIGNPSAFEKTLSQLGAVIDKSLRLPDHSNDVAQVQRWIEANQRAGQWILITEKDAMRWSSLLPHVTLRDIYILRVHMEFIRSHELWDLFLERIEKGIRERAR